MASAAFLRVFIFSPLFSLFQQHQLFIIDPKVAMTSIDRLPKELLIEIFSYLDKVDLKESIIVSKKWQSPATEAKNDVTLRAFQIHKIKTIREENSSNQDDYFNRLQLTKKLKVENDYADSLATFTYLAGHGGVGENQHISRTMLKSRCKIEQQQFYTLLSYLEILQDLDLERCDNQDLYMGFMRDLDPQCI